MLNGWKEALDNWGFLIPTFLVVMLAVFVGMQYYDSTRVVPTSALPGNTTTIIAREPGVPFNVAAFCNMPETKVVGGSYKAFNPEAQWSYKYTLINLNESVQWRTVPNTNQNEQNAFADHFITLPDGSPKLTDDGNALPAVELTKDAATCIWKKGGVPKE